jgi:hypothetical protein
MIIVVILKKLACAIYKCYVLFILFNFVLALLGFGGWNA